MMQVHTYYRSAQIGWKLVWFGAGHCKPEPDHTDICTALYPTQDVIPNPPHDEYRSGQACCWLDYYFKI